MNNNSNYLEKTYSSLIDYLNGVVKKNKLNSNEKLLDNSSLITDSLNSFFLNKSFTANVRKELLSNQNNIPVYRFNLDLSFEENSNKKIKLIIELNDKKELYLHNGAVDFSVTSRFLKNQTITQKSYNFTFLYSSDYTPHIIMSDEKMFDFTTFYFNDSDKKENLKTLNQEKKNIFIEDIQNMYALYQLYTVNPIVVLDYFFLNKSIDESVKEVYDLTYDYSLKNIDFDQYFIDTSKQKKLKMVAK